MRYTIYAPDLCDTCYRILADGKVWIPFDKIEVDSNCVEFILYREGRIIASIEYNHDDLFNMFNYGGFN